MATVTSATYYNGGNQANKVDNGENRYVLNGTFSGNQQPGDITLTPSLGAVDPSKTTITSQSTTQISGKFHYARSGSDVEDDGGTMDSSVGGGQPVSTDVTYPSTIKP